MNPLFIKVGHLIFQVSNINAIDTNTSDGYVDVFTSDSNEAPFKLARHPETDAFLAWVTHPSRCLDVDMIVE